MDGSSLEGISSLGMDFSSLVVLLRCCEGVSNVIVQNVGSSVQNVGSIAGRLRRASVGQAKYDCKIAGRDLQG